MAAKLDDLASSPVLVLALVPLLVMPGGAASSPVTANVVAWSATLVGVTSVATASVETSPVMLSGFDDA